MTNFSAQHELVRPSPLLDSEGNLVQVGWARQPLLDCNLEKARFYAVPWLQRFRIKRWDYYGLTTPTHYFSFTLADLGYAGQAFAYVVDLTTGDYHEETLTIPLGRGIFLPRNSDAPPTADSTEGESKFDNGQVRLLFRAEPQARHLSVTWPGFDRVRLAAEVTLRLPPEHES